MICLVDSMISSLYLNWKFEGYNGVDWGFVLGTHMIDGFV